VDRETRSVEERLDSRPSLDRRGAKDRTKVACASQTALVDGWKLNVSKPGEGHATRKWLFNLRNDPTEQNDLAPTHPEKLAELEAALAAHNAEQAPSLWSSTMSLAVTIDKDGSVAESPDDEYIYWSN